jgi:predicted dithiol-disulfide oxidoreductase (DUF899 family)
MKRHVKPHPPVVSRAEWQIARDALLAKEKAHTRAGDSLAAERRRLPMIKIDKNYIFEGRDSEASLVDLFHGRQQLILYHFMFGPTQDEGCDGCSMYVDNVTRAMSPSCLSLAHHKPNSSHFRSACVGMCHGFRPSRVILMSILA